MRNKLLIILFVLSNCFAFGQTIVTGTVNDAVFGDPISRASVKIAGKALGTNTSFDGKFTLKVAEKPPFIIEISLIGYQSESIEITKNNQQIKVSLSELFTPLNEIVLSASRTLERIMESPVTIERMSIRDIKSTPSPIFYDALENLKGVDINTNSLTFKSVNTRGFATFTNIRFMQLVDGMDNSSPALNFPIGNLLGMPELDVQSIELLPGASSALYGANAFNGIIFMNSKNPFDYQGISASFKTGITSQQAGGNNNFYDFELRMAHAFDDKFAAKATLSFFKGTEWYATDYRNKNIERGTHIPGNRDSDLNYDGVNVYGDEVSFNIKEAAKILESLDFIPSSDGSLIPNPFPKGGSALIPSVNVSRTGYNEIDLIDYEAKNIKFSGSMHYRPWSDDRLELIYNAKIGTGNTIYQGVNRFSVKNFFIQQHKLEFKGRNFFVRGYLTEEDAGDSYDAVFAGININKKWKDHEVWFGQYVGEYFTSVLSGATDSEAHKAARKVAEQGRLEPGTEAFKTAFNEVVTNPDLVNGAKFSDNTKLYHVDANLNLRDYIDWAEIQLGGSYRQYELISQGSIFTDYNGPIVYGEYGLYTQVQKKALDDRLKFTGSIRYDKSKNFEGNFSPRISLAYAVGEVKQHNFRASFQTGFRNPTTQDQYIGLNAGGVVYLVGSAPDNLDRYTTDAKELSSQGTILTGLTEKAVSGREAYENAFSLSSVLNDNPTKSNVSLVKPEKVSAYEIGYRGILPFYKEKLGIDFSVYYNDYSSFISNQNVIVPLYGKIGAADSLALKAIDNKDSVVFSTLTNSSADISSYGLAIGLDTNIFNNYNLGFSYTWSRFTFDRASDPDFEPGFNTPEHKVKFQFGNTELFDNFGFNINLRWQNEYLWESAFLDAVIGARTVLDAQVNYSIPKWKSTFKIGGTNLTGKEYLSAPGVGAIGSQYFISWIINN
ncbi:MAG: TonB-dependent receptor [Tenacibaculum sp.]